MATVSTTRNDASLRTTPVTIGICVLLAIAAVFLWQEHRAHVLGILPYLLLAACPLIHLLMHGKHGGHHNGREGHEHHRRREIDGGQS